MVGSDGATLLVEAYVPDRRRGEIVALRPDGGSSSPVHTGLDGHLSYPCLIEDGGVIYCLPENSSSGRVTLLRAERFPERFEPAAVLLENFAGVDCTPFRHDGRWWMLAMDHNDQDVAKLFLFHADHLLGPWAPHRWNPVRCDLRNARPAGPPFRARGPAVPPGSGLFAPLWRGDRAQPDRRAVDGVVSRDAHSADRARPQWSLPGWGAHADATWGRADLGRWQADRRRAG